MKNESKKQNLFGSNIDQSSSQVNLSPGVGRSSSFKRRGVGIHERDTLLNIADHSRSKNLHLESSDKYQRGARPTF